MLCDYFIKDELRFYLHPIMLMLVDGGSDGLTVVLDGWEWTSSEAMSKENCK